MVFRFDSQLVFPWKRLIGSFWSRRF